jgi:hypothetical protein
MDTREYFEKLNDKFDKLSDAEFMRLLVDAGIESCPLEEDYSFELKISSSVKTEYIYKTKIYNDIVVLQEVA